MHMTQAIIANRLKIAILGTKVFSYRLKEPDNNGKKKEFIIECFPIENRRIIILLNLWIYFI